MLSSFLFALLLVAPGFGGLNLTASPSPNQASTWTVESVGFFGGSAAPEIVVDSTDRPHVLYCPPGEVWHAVRAGGTWDHEKLTDTIGGGICGGFAVGPADVPYASLFIPPVWDPNHFYLAVKRNGTWSYIERPRSAGGLAVDTTGVPHIAAFIQLNATTWSLRHLSFASGSWYTEDVDRFIYPGFLDFGWVSLRLHVSGEPRLLYYDSAREDVRYAFRDFSGWHVEVVEHIGSLGQSGRHGSLVLEGNGVAHAAYMANMSISGDSASLRYAVRGTSGWVSETLATGPPKHGFFSSLDMDSRGTLSIAYLRVTAGSPLTYCDDDVDIVFGTRVSGSWSWETVVDGKRDCHDPSNTKDDEFAEPWFTTMATDRCGNPHLAYYFSWWNGLTDLGSGVRYATKGRPCSTSPTDLKHEAIQRIKALKDQALARGDKHFVHELDEAEGEVWESLGFKDPFRPNSVASLPAFDVTAKPRDHDKVRLTFGPSWSGRFAGYASLRIAWSNGVITVINLPPGWSTKDREFRVTPWLESWHQDVRIHTERERQKHRMTLEVHAHEASMNFALSFDGDLVSQLVFLYSMRHLWVDATHLDPEKGEKVFDEERHAVRELLCSGGDDDEDDDCDDGSAATAACALDPRKWTDAERMELDAECDAIANLLVKADDLLARTGLEDAKGTPIQNPKHAKEVQHEIERAERELKKASSEWSEHEYTDAIEHFGKTWEHAERAIRDAARR